MDYPDHNVPETRSVDTMVDTVRAHLLDSVRLRLRADVPVAVYLSGGIDSSAVAGIANHLVRERHTQIGNSGRSSSLTAEDKVPLRHGPNGADLKSELQDTTESNIDVFTIRFPDAEAFDESLIARRTANFLGARMHTVDVTEAE